MFERPEDIPQDVWDKATEWMGASYLNGGREVVARAIMSERERCAKVCDVFIEAYDEEIASLGLVQPRRGSPAKYAVKCIAADIRGASHD